MIQNRFSIDRLLHENSFDFVNNLIFCILLAWLWCVWKLPRLWTTSTSSPQSFLIDIPETQLRLRFTDTDYNNDYNSHPSLLLSTSSFSTFFPPISSPFQLSLSLSLSTYYLPHNTMPYDKSMYTAANTTGMRSSGQSRWQPKRSASSSAPPPPSSSGSDSETGSYALGASNQEDNRNRQVSAPVLVLKVS